MVLAIFKAFISTKKAEKQANLHPRKKKDSHNHANRTQMIEPGSANTIQLAKLTPEFSIPYARKILCKMRKWNCISSYISVFKYISIKMEQNFKLLGYRYVIGYFKNLNSDVGLSKED